MRVHVAIIGGGPSGLLLGQLLLRHGITSVILERQTRQHVLGRIRAGVLESGTVKLLRQANASDRLDNEALIHNSVSLALENQVLAIPLKEFTNTAVTIYGQTELTHDLYDARDATEARTIFEVSDVTLHDLNEDAPYVTFRDDNSVCRVDCDFIAGCDGFHGISRKSIPSYHRQEFEKIYPFGWLGVLSKTPPVSDTLIYARSKLGFALCSMRNANLSRYYIQCPLTDKAADWSDDAFWTELRRRLPQSIANSLISGPAIEKSIAPLRSFVTEPMQYGRLFLCGDAAHIVPPTGAKGLNTAVSDVYYLYLGLSHYYRDGEEMGLEKYSERALARVWKAVRFSWWFTNLMHDFPDQSSFDRKLQQAELSFLLENRAAQAVLAQNYVGLPY
ncbi:MAG: 4-hydroxybenzoate 3-monooxygenase [Aestuariivita sp.]|nr:4-hydroxybenzoate 3-monooxygenase [Aestuariivita sp.]MCY4202048.1 4-hydroxybenzoate 3-monooxygenase [Aestuariivita sp.]